MGEQMKENAEKYLMFGFDMETDVGSTSRDYKGVEFGTPEIIKILKKNGADATFFFTGDCVLRNREIVEMVNSKEYEIGCHSLYHEDVGEPSFSTSSFSPVLEEELEHRLEINIGLVKKITKKDPVSFRSPRGFASNNLMKILKNLKFQIDSSYIQAVHLERDFPYYVSAEDWRKEGDQGILELPLFAFDLENADDNDFQKRLDQWPRIRTHGADFVFENMQPIVKRQIDKHGFSAMTFYMHPWEFYPMPKSIKYSEGTLYYDAFLYKNTGDVQIKEFDKFLGKCLDAGFKILSLKGFKKVFGTLTAH
jgi:peptidoglycan/xylan/chitin deacetylase (PgdA/CDA1 family)